MEGGREERERVLDSMHKKQRGVRKLSSKIPKHMAYFSVEFGLQVQSVWGGVCSCACACECVHACVLACAFLCSCDNSRSAGCISRQVSSSLHLHCCCIFCSAACLPHCPCVHEQLLTLSRTRTPTCISTRTRTHTLAYLHPCTHNTRAYLHSYTALPVRAGRICARHRKRAQVPKILRL